MQAREIVTHAITKKITTVFLLIFASILAVLFKLILALIIRDLVTEIFPVPVSDHPELAIRIVSFVVSVILWFMMEVLCRNQSVSLGTYVTICLSKEVYSSALKAEISEIEKQKGTTIVQAITRDCPKIGNEFIGKNWVSVIRDTIFLIGCFIAFMFTEARLGLVVFGCLILYYMITKSYTRYADRITGKAEEEIRIREHRIQEIFSKIRSIKLKNGTESEEEEFQKQNDAYIELNKSTGLIQSIKNINLSELLIGLIVALILGLGGYFSTREQPPIPGTIVMYAILIPFLVSSFRRLMHTGVSFALIEPELVNIDQILSFKSEFKAEPISGIDEVNILKFRDVSYGGSDSGIDLLNFELRSGEKLGILSLGESRFDTIFELMTKLSRPKDGMILINNCDINKISAAGLRNIVTAIPRKKRLFTDTIMKNITYPLEFDEYKYNDALNRSGLKDLLAEYEAKDQTIIEEDMLSEDMVERITFANAFYKDSRIIILNNAISALDIRGEDAIMKEIFKLKNKIIIIMTDKIYNVLNCDKVLILEKENVAEYGKVHELLQDPNSIFSKMTKKVKSSKSAKA